MARAEKSRKLEEETDETISSPDIEPISIEQISAESSPTIEEIQVRAYEIYLERGGADGNDQEDWLQAERELGGTDAGQDIS